MNITLIKSAFRSIKRTFSRFISIVIIVAIGLAFFAGIQAASPDMKATAQRYFADTNYMDLRIQSSLGLTNADIRAIAEVEGVEYVMPQKFIDALVWVNGNIETDIDGSQISARAYGVDLEFLADLKNGIIDGSYINKVELIEGTFPTAADECLVDASNLSTPDSYKIGNVIRLEGDGDSITASLGVTEFKIVGIIRSPQYVSFERGNSLVGSGKIGTFIFIPNEAFLTDYYTEAYVKVKGAGAYDGFSDKYFDYLVPTAERLQNISYDRLNVRATDLNLNLPAKISDAQSQLDAKQNEINTKFADAQAKVDQLRVLATNGDAILAAAQAEYNTKFTQAQQALLSGQTEYNQQLAAWQEQSAIVAQAEANWTEQYNLFTQAQESYNQYNALLTQAGNQLNAAQSSVDATTSLIATIDTVMTSLSAVQSAALSQEQLQGIVGVLETAYPELYQSVITLTAQGTASSAINIIAPMLDEKKAELAAAQAELDSKTQTYNSYYAAVNEAYNKLKQAETVLASTKSYLENAKTKLNSAKSQLDSYASTLSDGQNKVTLEQIQAQQNLYQLQIQVGSAADDLLAAETELANAQSEANAEIRRAQTQIDNANNLLSKINTASWTVFNRNDNPGFTTFSGTITSLASLANLFPLFFILVAALVCLTTMSRMIHDERIEMGTLKALGFSNRQITLKYIIYSLTAAVIGSVIGIWGGMYMFPYVINAAYGIMYDIPPLTYTFPVHTIILGILIAICSTSVISVIVCRRELRGVPAALMRPKPPKAGKHVFLEKISFVWKRLSFSSKVTVRNTFRNAQRCIMTIFGIAGCTALVLSGFGLYDSVNAIMSKQYDNGISQYDFQIVFADNQMPGASETMLAVTGDNRVDSAMLTSMTSLVGYSDRSPDELDVYVLVPENAEELSNYIKLQDRKSGAAYTLDDTGALITEKFARETDTKPGDIITVRNSSNECYDIQVAGIVENYTFHYIYLTQTAYTAIFGKEAEFGYAMGKLTADVKNEAQTAASGAVTDKALLATDLMKYSTVNAVAYTTDTMESFTEIIDALSYVIIVFILSAGILAFVVLYNLANINIQERRREIATLKVLGFYESEVSSYILRENAIMTFLGMIFGLVLGVYIHKLLLLYTEIDTVMFGRSIEPLSFVYAACATVGFAVIISLLMQRKLRKNNMAESLKSIE